MGVLIEDIFCHSKSILQYTSNWRSFLLNTYLLSRVIWTVCSFTLLFSKHLARSSADMLAVSVKKAFKTESLSENKKIALSIKCRFLIFSHFTPNGWIIYTPLCKNQWHRFQFPNKLFNISLKCSEHFKLDIENICLNEQPIL